MRETRPKLPQCLTTMTRTHMLLADFDGIAEAEAEATRQIHHGHVPTAYDQTKPHKPD